MIILQTLPAVALGLYTRWFHRVGLISGWAAGMTAGMVLLYNISNPANNHAHFGGSAFPLGKLGFDTSMTVYAGFLALLVNLVVAALVTLLARRLGALGGRGRHRATRLHGRRRRPGGQGGRGAGRVDVRSSTPPLHRRFKDGSHSTLMRGS